MRLNKTLNLIFFSLFVLGMTSCNALLQTSDRKLAKKINAAHVTYIDVRTPEEFQEKTLSQAINIPVAELPNRIGFFNENQDENFIVFCASGKRATQAKKILRKHKIKNVFVGTSAKRIEILKNER